MIKEISEAKSLFFHAAGITVRLGSEVQAGKHTLESKFDFFKTPEPMGRIVTVQHVIGNAPEDEIRSKTNLKTVLDNGTWNLSISDSVCIYKYNSEYFAPIPYSVTCIFDFEHNTGKSYFDQINTNQYRNLQLPSLTGLGSDQILFSRLLADKGGFLFHANGVSLSGKTLLFSGKSGAGKSTISALMKKKGGTIFCDDRILVQKDGPSYTASGSWIHPGATIDFNCTNKIDAIFFIEQSKTNQIKPITDIKKKYYTALTSLIKNFFVSRQWDATMDSLHNFVRDIPFYSLKFNLTDDIYDLICDEIL